MSKYKNYTVSLTISVIDCKNKKEALEQFEEVLADKRYDHDSIEIEGEDPTDGCEHPAIKRNGVCMSCGYNTLRLTNKQLKQI